METEPEKPHFKAPEKLIRTAADMQTWEKSETFYEILGFINSLSYIIQGKSNSYKCDDSKPIQKILEMLDSMEKLAKDTPPIDQPARFGNAAFRYFCMKMKNVGIFFIYFPGYS
jgi:serine/threonine-protein phosphatase 2A activator